jgi:hypothetical protein
MVPRIGIRGAVAVVFVERRRASRRVINRLAQYYCEGNQFPRNCLVSDISETGARLHSEADMPEAFVLEVSGEGFSAKHDCRVVWRLGHEMGVAFERPRDRFR